MANAPKTRRMPKGKTLEEKYPGWTFQSFLLPEGTRDQAKAIPWDSLTDEQKLAANQKMMKNTSEVMSEYYSRPDKEENFQRFLQACDRVEAAQEGA